MMQITGTFLDEISHDIPSANWGVAEWEKDFDVMRSIGIDTVILIRAGYKDQAVFNSNVLKKYYKIRPVYLDLLDLFLDQAERCEMNLYFGTYDPGEEEHFINPAMELQANLDLCEEIILRYGDRKAFKGWYLSREINAYSDSATKLFLKLATHLKSMRDFPILISPYVRGRKQFDDPITPEEHEYEWNKVFEVISGHVDIVAFQDGQIDFNELPVFMDINASLARKYGIESWSNVESFERGMPIDFLPIAWPNMRYKIETAQKAGMQKLITFEFSHFMSPNSPYPSAHNLYNRYKEYLEESNEFESCCYKSNNISNTLAQEF